MSVLHGDIPNTTGAVQWGEMETGEIRRMTPTGFCCLWCKHVYGNGSFERKVIDCAQMHVVINTVWCKTFRWESVFMVFLIVAQPWEFSVNILLNLTKSFQGFSLVTAKIFPFKCILYYYHLMLIFEWCCVCYAQMHIRVYVHMHRCTHTVCMWICTYIHARTYLYACRYTYACMHIHAHHSHTQIYTHACTRAHTHTHTHTHTHPNVCSYGTYYATWVVLIKSDSIFSWKCSQVTPIILLCIFCSGTEEGSTVLYSGSIWGRTVRPCTQNCQGQEIGEAPNLQVSKTQH